MIRPRHFATRFIVALSAIAASIAITAIYLTATDAATRPAGMADAAAVTPNGTIVSFSAGSLIESTDKGATYSTLAFNGDPQGLGEIGPAGDVFVSGRDPAGNAELVRLTPDGAVGDSIPLPTVDPALALSGVAASPDGQTIFVDATRRTGSAFSLGEYLESPDGGATWRVDTPPAYGAVSIANDGSAVLAGGALGDQIYVRRQWGGWQAVAPRRPLAATSAAQLRCSAGGDATLTCTWNTNWRSAGVQQYSALALGSNAIAASRGEAISGDNAPLVDANNDLVFDGARVLRPDGSTTNFASDYPQAAAALVASNAKRRVVVLDTYGQCTNKTACSDTSITAVSDDGGATWSATPSVIAD